VASAFEALITSGVATSEAATMAAKTVSDWRMVLTSLTFRAPFGAA
jgi:hypothetical protein